MSDGAASPRASGAQPHGGLQTVYQSELVYTQLTLRSYLHEI